MRAVIATIHGKRHCTDGSRLRRGHNAFGDAVWDQWGKSPQGPTDITVVGVLSPYGTAGQGGNVKEWEETEFDLVNDCIGFSHRGLRGGVWLSFSDDLLTGRTEVNGPSYASSEHGFRVASIPSLSQVRCC